MSYYDTFLSVNKDAPSEKWRDGLQELVNQQFDNSSTYWDDIEEEIEFGSLEFKPIEARITQVVDAKTGQRNNDDFKKITFKNIQYHPDYGTRYRFDNNIWLVYSTSGIRKDTSSVYIRRCNNTMNSQDKYGNIHEEPCYIDYKITENQLFRNPDLDVPSGRAFITCQLNKHTEHLNINDRFVFGDDVYKIRERAKFDRTRTFDKNSSKLLSYYADFDNKADYDDLETGVADYKKYNYKITSFIDEISNIVGTSGRINYKILLDNELASESVYFTSSDESIASIDKLTGDFVLNSVGECVFKLTMVNKSDVYLDIDINVVDTIENNYTTDVIPDVGTSMEPYYLRMNEHVKFSIVGSNNGVIQNINYTFEAIGVQDRNYDLYVLDNNSFIVTNKKPSSDILIITCTPENTNYPVKEIRVRLGGL